jgi:DNA-binding CsgD family transcriptional regulator
MEDFALADLACLLEFVRSVQAAPDLPAYVAALFGIRALVPATVIGYNEVDLGTGDTYSVLDPPDAAFDGVEDVFAEVADQHPVLRHFQEAGATGPMALSDFLSPDKLHGLDLYTRVYGPMGVEDQLSFLLPSTPGTMIAVLINRSRPGFSERERRLVELVQPNLGQAFTDARARSDPLDLKRLEELGLSPREAEVMQLLATGLSSEEIAERLVISPHTLRRHVQRILDELEVGSRAAAVARVLGPPVASSN